MVRTPEKVRDLVDRTSTAAEEVGPGGRLSVTALQLPPVGMGIGIMRWGGSREVVVGHTLYSLVRKPTASALGPRERFGTGHHSQSASQSTVPPACTHWS